VCVYECVYEYNLHIALPQYSLLKQQCHFCCVLYLFSFSIVYCVQSLSLYATIFCSMY